jgi:hypothetical protein
MTVSFRARLDATALFIGYISESPKTGMWSAGGVYNTFDEQPDNSFK